jgi:hypothetical protein
MRRSIKGGPQKTKGHGAFRCGEPSLPVSAQKQVGYGLGRIGPAGLHQERNYGAFPDADEVWAWESPDQNTRRRCHGGPFRAE